MRKQIAVGLALALAGLSASASAQPLGEPGQFTLGFERLFGFHWWNVNIDVPAPGQDVDETGTMFGVGWHNATNHNRPRVGGDYFILDRLSLGGAVGFWSGSNDDDGFLFYPRVGYTFPLASSFAFWPRGGFSYWDIGNQTQVSLAGEGQFVFFPSASWGLMFGPTLDLGLTGESGDQDMTVHNFGITVGGLGLF